MSASFLNKCPRGDTKSTVISIFEKSDLSSYTGQPQIYVTNHEYMW